MGGFRTILEGTSQEVWSQHIEAVITKLLIPPKKLSEEASRHWTLIHRKSHRWNWRHDLVEALRALELRQALAFFDELVGSETGRRISALIFGTAFLSHHLWIHWMLRYQPL